MSKANPTGTQTKLDGFKILVTRPAGQSASLLEAIRAQGGTAHAFPLIEIHPATKCPDTLSRMGDYDLAIFVSRNAVECAWGWISDPDSPAALPENIDIAAVGQATLAALEKHDCPSIIAPSSRFDSEGLLATAELENVAGKRILIIRGQSGREKLAESLRSRGAQVDYAEVYQRLPTKRVLTFEADEIDVITITSSEALATLQQIASDTAKSWLLDKPLLVLHGRIAMRARELGFTLNPVIAEQASEAAMLDALHSMNNN